MPQQLSLALDARPEDRVDARPASPLPPATPSPGSPASPISLPAASSAPPAEPFKQAYKRFVTDLRTFYPQAKIVCSIGPLMNDNYPVGRKHWTLIQRYVSELVQELNASGDSSVYYFAYTPIVADPYGEDWHPTAEVHARMADELATFIHDHTDLGW